MNTFWNWLQGVAFGVAVGILGGLLITRQWYPMICATYSWSP